MTIYKPYLYQDFAYRHLLDHPYAGLLLEMGLGKTVVTLSAIAELYRRGEVKKVLVIAPKLVARDTWATEAGKWEHTKHLRLSLMLGTEKARIRAMREPADIYVINRENVEWLVAFYAGAWPFDMVIIDELSSFKSPKSKRFKALRMVRPKMQRVVGLTGTFRPNGLIDIWSQMYLLDRGERLGDSVTKYRNKYFKAVSKQGHIVYKYGLKQEEDIDLYGRDINEKEIYQKIGDICISMQAKDYLQLPERLDRTVLVRLSATEKLHYREFERDQVLQLADAETISAVNAAALTTKLLQYANGAVYGEQKMYYEAHQAKLEALEEIIENANSEPVLVFYSFQHDLARIRKKLKGYQVREIKTAQDIADWNAGKIEVAAAHPASAGHGLNLQAGGHIIVWFGLPWSLELYQQANARLHRQGQIQNVIIHHLLTEGTMDLDVMEALKNKAGGQQALMDAVKARISKYIKSNAA